MTELYFLIIDDWNDVDDVVTDEDEALDRVAREGEGWYIKPVVDLNAFADHTIQTKDGAKAVIQRIKNSLNASDTNAE